MNTESRIQVFFYVSSIYLFILLFKKKIKEVLKIELNVKNIKTR